MEGKINQEEQAQSLKLKGGKKWEKNFIIIGQPLLFSFIDCVETSFYYLSKSS